jgi:hypothetical protein
MNGVTDQKELWKIPWTDSLRWHLQVKMGLGQFIELQLFEIIVAGNKSSKLFITFRNSTFKMSTFRKPILALISHRWGSVMVVLKWSNTTVVNGFLINSIPLIRRYSQGVVKGEKSGPSLKIFHKSC